MVFWSSKKKGEIRWSGPKDPFHVPNGLRPIWLSPEPHRQSLSLAEDSWHWRASMAALLSPRNATNGGCRYGFLQPEQKNGKIRSDSGRIRQPFDHPWVALHRTNWPTPMTAGKTPCTVAKMGKKQSAVAAKPDPRPSGHHWWTLPPRLDPPPSDLQSPMANLAWNVARSNEFQEKSTEFKI